MWYQNPIEPQWHHVNNTCIVLNLIAPISASIRLVSQLSIRKYTLSNCHSGIQILHSSLLTSTDEEFRHLSSRTLAATLIPMLRAARTQYQSSIDPRFEKETYNRQRCQSI